MTLFVNTITIIVLLLLVMVSLWLLVSIIALSLFLEIGWFSGRRVLRITSIIFSTICFAVCMVTGIRLLM